MRIKMVSKLRRHDAAIMELGLEYTDKMAIPPGVLAFPLSGYCIAECTQTVINGFYHCYSYSRIYTLPVYDCLICTLFYSPMRTNGQMFLYHNFYVCTPYVLPLSCTLLTNVSAHRSHRRYQNRALQFLGHNCIHIYVVFAF